MLWRDEKGVQWFSGSVLSERRGGEGLKDERHEARWRVASGEHGLAEQHNKSRLRKMLVAGERFAHTVFFHDDKR